MKVRTVLLSSAMLLVLSCLAPDITGRGIARAESSPHAQCAGPGGVLFPAVPLKKPGLCLGDVCQEVKLARMVNESRRSQGLPPIPVSRSLTMVAQAHVRWRSEPAPTVPRPPRAELQPAQLVKPGRKRQWPVTPRTTCTGRACAANRTRLLKVFTTATGYEIVFRGQRIQGYRGSCSQRLAT